MKKLFFAAAACCMLALSATFVSCDPNKAQCWLITVTLQDSTTEEHYFYGTGIEADAQMELYHQALDAKSVRREQTFLSKDNCHK